MYFQGKGVMTTYWLLGEESQDKGETYEKDDEWDITADNDDEGIDDVDEISTHATVTFHVSDHDTVHAGQV